MPYTLAYVCLAILATLCGCAPTSDPAPRPLAVRLSGARALLQSEGGRLPIFDAAERPRLRLDEPLEAVEVELVGPGGARLQPALIPLQLGERRWLVISALPASWAGDGAVEVRSGARRRRWPVRWQPAPERYEALRPVVALRQAGRLEAAQMALTQAMPTLRGLERLWAQVEAGRLAYRRQRAEAAIEQWGIAADLAVELGVYSEAINRHLARVYVALRIGALQRAQGLLAQAEALIERLPSDHLQQAAARSAHAYYKALLSQASMRHLDAQDLFERSTQFGQASGSTKHLVASDLARNNEHHQSGQYLTLLEGILAIERRDPTLFYSPRDRLIAQMNLGWQLVELTVRGELGLDASFAESILDEGFRQALQQDDLDIYNRQALNAHWLHTYFGLLPSPDALSDLSETFEGELDVVIFARSLTSRVLWWTGRPAQALAHLEQTLHLAHRALPFSADEYRGPIAHEIADVLWQLGERDLALLHDEDAWAATQQAARRLTITHGRSSFLHRRTDQVDAYIERLLAVGDHAQALHVLDAARAQAITSIKRANQLTALSPEQQIAWLGRVEAIQRQQDEITALIRGLDDLSVQAAAEQRRRVEAQSRDLSLAFDRLHLWLDGLNAQPRPPLDLARLRAKLGPDQGALVLYDVDPLWVSDAGVQRLMSPEAVDEAAAGRDHVYIVPYGQDPTGWTTRWPDRSLSFLPYLSLLQEPTTMPQGPPLVIYNPTGDLPYAGREGRWVADHLRPDHPALITLGGPGDLRDQAVAHLDEAALFHFAGHGVIDPADPWASHLSMGPHTALNLADLLLLQPKVGVAVLSGCKTAARGHLSGREAIGLPEAFLIAGARTVIATAADVDDQVGQAFVEGFYQHGGHQRPGPAFKETISELRRKDPAAASVFQLWGRP